jgi:predicted TIM-barrel fold metal-dependent hydrolase
MKTIPILDTHQHLLMTDRWPYSWTSGLEPLENRRFDYAKYLEASAGTGIAGTLFMESTPDNSHWQEETRRVLEMAADPETLVRGVIANCRPEDEVGFEAWVESIRGPNLNGVRRILHVEPDEMSQQPTFVRNVRKLGDWNLTFDLCFLARQLPVALELVRQCEGTQMILDHCGVPDIAAGAIDPWREHIRALSELPNLACKISGLLAYCAPDNANAEAVRPYVEHCIECFGWDRVVWGGDWPVCLLTADLKTWVETSRALVAGESETNQRKLFYENAERIYGTTMTDDQ